MPSTMPNVSHAAPPSRSLPPQTPVVVAARRTAVTGSGRAQAGLGPAELAAAVLRALSAELVALSGDRTPAVDDVLLGCCCGPGGDVARVAALAAGLGEQVPGSTVDRQCGSGLEALRLAAALIGSGQAEVVLAGGTESASNARDGGAKARFAPPPYPDPGMGEAADALAAARGVSRARQDAYAARSHALACAARRAGGFADELVATLPAPPVDDRPRAGLDAGTLARFRPAFGAAGTVTAGNSCGINDGAAALAVVPERLRAAWRVPGLAVLGSAVCGVDPALPGLGAVPAIRRLLHRAGLEAADLQVLEITEAFAAQLLACTDALGLDAGRAPGDGQGPAVCPQGGAIALGHPWGASGALLVTRLFSWLVRRRTPGSGWGVAACPVGGGQGVAVLLHRVGPDA